MEQGTGEEQGGGETATAVYGCLWAFLLLYATRTFEFTRQTKGYTCIHFGRFRCTVKILAGLALSQVEHHRSAALCQRVEAKPSIMTYWTPRQPLAPSQSRRNSRTKSRPRQPVLTAPSSYRPSSAPSLFGPHHRSRLPLADHPKASLHLLRTQRTTSSSARDRLTIGGRVPRSSVIRPEHKTRRTGQTHSCTTGRWSRSTFVQTWTYGGLRSAQHLRRTDDPLIKPDSSDVAWCGGSGWREMLSR